MTLTAIAFDLDDTLHDFSAASAAATHAVYDDISQRDGIAHDALHHTYQQIISASVKSFTDGRTSYEYRYDRMSALLKRFSLHSTARAHQCVEIYAQVLKSALTLEDGAIDALTSLKARSIRIAVISE